MEQRKMKTDGTYWLIWGIILAAFALISLLKYLLNPFRGFGLENEMGFLGYLQVLYKSEWLSCITSFLSGAAMGLILAVTAHYRLRLTFLAFLPLLLEHISAAVCQTADLFTLGKDQTYGVSAHLFRIFADFALSLILIIVQALVYNWLCYVCRKKQKSDLRFFLIAAALYAVTAFLPAGLQVFASLWSTNTEAFLGQLGLAGKKLAVCAVWGTVAFAAAYFVHRCLYLRRDSAQPENISLE